MVTSKRTHGILAALLGVFAALAVLAGSAQAGNTPSTGMSTAEYRALMLRSEALNEKYLRESYTPASTSAQAHRALIIRSEALNRKYGLGDSAATTAAVAPAVAPASTSAQAHRALIIRSEALNRKYGLGDSAATTAAVTPAVVTGSGFAWDDFGFGAATVLGVVLAGIGVLFVSRRGRGALRAYRSS